jgi:cytochrome b561
VPSNVARTGFVFILIHWVLVLMGFVLLGLGWYIQYMPPPPQTRSFLLDIHMSSGLTSAILLSIQLILWIVFKPSSFTNEFSKWKRLLVYTLYRLIYVSFILMPRLFSAGRPYSSWVSLCLSGVRLTYR